ncbi:hypothetical protein BGZ63DRAFT_82094 [Mariannaea sp. PMI_226]|nr:hypothetical protein BGZ63DRAFT_82094 [Mariannaea sp. PMI_226]
MVLCVLSHSWLSSPRRIASLTDWMVTLTQIIVSQAIAVLTGKTILLTPGGEAVMSGNTFMIISVHVRPLVEAGLVYAIDAITPMPHRRKICPVFKLVSSLFVLFFARLASHHFLYPPICLDISSSETELQAR